MQVAVAHAVETGLRIKAVTAIGRLPAVGRRGPGAKARGEDPGGAEGVVAVALQHGAGRVGDRGDVHGVAQGVEARGGAAADLVAQDEVVERTDAPDELFAVAAGQQFLEDLPGGGVVVMGRAGGGCADDPPGEAVVGIGRDRAPRVADLDQPIPGVVLQGVGG